MKFHRFLLVSILSSFSTAAFGQHPNHHFIETKLKDDELAKRVTGEFLLPQFRVYDRKGRQLGEFDYGFKPATFKQDLGKVLQGSPIPGKPVLEKEINQMVKPNNKPLEKLAAADFTIVEYWAEWCVPCRQQFELLHEVLEEHKNFTINILHVQADPMKLPGARPEH